MVEIKADPEGHRMNITLDCALTVIDFTRVISQIQEESTSLEPGWTAAIDLRGMWIDDPFFIDQLRLLQQTIVECGAKKVGTLLDHVAIQMQLGQAGNKTRANEIARRFYNLSEWEQFLAQV
ncbi:MAG: hypothetical protein EHM70_11740 [Chloroflexota bacterium]|nr:MAG: hypothetical protein EHM70_11740 [Chloroflexota bacterium]